MPSKVWNELALDLPEWVTRSAPPVDAAPPRPWPPVLMRDYLDASKAQALGVGLDACLGQVVDFLAAHPDNVVAVIDRGNLLGALYEDWALDAIRDDGMQALERPLADIMEAAPWCCDSTDSPYVVATALEARALRRAPVLQGGRVAGTADLAGLQRFIGTT